MSECCPAGECKPKKRIFLKALVVVIVIFIIGIVLIIGNIGKVITVVVETAGTQVTGVTTELESAQVSILKGSMSLNGLAVHNPEGYHLPHLFKVDTLYGKLANGSVLSDEIVIPELLISGMEVTIESKVLTNNLQDILDHVKKMTPESAPKTDDTVEDQAAKSGKKLSIGKIVLENVVMKIKLLPIAGKTDVITIEPGRLEITDISTGDSPAVIVPLVFTKIIEALAKSVVNQGGKLPESLIKGLGDGLESLAPLLQAPESLLKESGNALDGIGKELEKGLGGLLSGNKNKANDDKK